MNRGRVCTDNDRDHNSRQTRGESEHILIIFTVQRRREQSESAVSDSTGLYKVLYNTLQSLHVEYYIVLCTDKLHTITAKYSLVIFTIFFFFLLGLNTLHKVLRLVFASLYLYLHCTYLYCASQLCEYKPLLFQPQARPNTRLPGSRFSGAGRVMWKVTSLVGALSITLINLEP